MKPNMQPTQDANMGKALSRLSQYMHKTLGIMIYHFCPRAGGAERRDDDHRAG